MSVYDRLNFDLSRIPEREDMFMPNRPTVIDTPLSNVAQPPVFNQLTPEQQQALQNFQNPAPVQVDLGGGLGGFSIPQITLDNILANMPQGIFGYQPPVIEPEVETVETVETGLEDTGVSQEVVEDVEDTTSDYDLSDYMLVVGDPTNPGPGVVVRDPETGEFPPGYEQGNVEGPAGTIPPTTYTPSPTPPPPSVFSEPSPTIVDSGITTATPVVDDRNLITPNVEVPEGSMTGLGSYFTAPQIDQIVDPGYSRPATTDMDKLLEMQRQTYGNFLYAPTPAPAPAPSPDTGTAPSEGDGGSGYAGDVYNPGITNPVSNPITDIYTNPTGIQFNDIQNQMSMNPYSFDNIGNYYTAYNPAQEMQQGILNSIYNRGYGSMDFPVFSGITSLVPSDTRNTIGR